VTNLGTWDILFVDCQALEAAFQTIEALWLSCGVLRCGRRHARLENLSHLFEDADEVILALVGREIRLLVVLGNLVGKPGPAQRLYQRQFISKRKRKRKRKRKPTWMEGPL